MVVAGLAASGETTIKGLNYLDRGYDRLDLKLQKLGAKIERIEENAESTKKRMVLLLFLDNCLIMRMKL